MKIGDFYNSPAIINAFGKTRVYDTIRNIKKVWPKFLPEYNQQVNNYHAAWMLFILCHSRQATQPAVQAAILAGKELKRDNQPFITYLGDLLYNSEEIESIRNIFVFYRADNCVQVTHTDGSTKIFQGKTKAETVRRAAIMDSEFLAEVSEMLLPFEEEEVPEFDEERIHPDDEIRQK